MTKIKISCPITWYEQYDWIRKNCKQWEDVTCWAAWQVGLDDIYLIVEDKDAVWFNLVWQ